MYTLDELIAQNQDIAELSAVLSALVAEPELRTNRYVCDLITRYYDKVWMHLMFEDKSLYTDLLQHPDPEVVAKVKAFHDSAKEIKHDFGRHIKQWCHLDLSTREAEDFSARMKNIISRVMDRVDIENQQIIPLADKNS